MLTQDFTRLWAGDALSQFGTRISMLVIPVLAATTLDASAFQVALLTTFETLPFLLLGLPAGAWSDRMRRRPVLIAGDLGRAVTLGSVPLAAALGVLTLGQLYTVAVATGVLTLFFDVSHRSYLPQVVGRDRLVEANSRLEGNRTVSYAVGPTLGGYLVQWIGAPLAILADALSFLWSAGWISAIRTPESAPAPAARSLRREIAEGLRFVLGQPTIRATALFGAAANLSIAMTSAVEVVFLLRTVRLSPGTIGLLMGVGSLGAVAGALAAARIGRRPGPGRALAVAGLGLGLSGLLIPLTGPGPRLLFFVAGGALFAFWISVYAVVSVSMRQALCPDHLLGRMTATIGFLLWGAMPLGGVLAGAVAGSWGLRTALWTAAVLVLAAAVCLVLARPWRADIRRDHRRLPDRAGSR
jgi:MFS family permease